jgi:hypothetical protein
VIGCHPQWMTEMVSNCWAAAAVGRMLVARAQFLSIGELNQAALA